METQTPNTQEPHSPKVHLEWTALMHPEHERTHTWYIGAGICAGILMIYALFTGAWSFALIIALVAGAYVFVRKTPSAMGSIRLDEEGCTWNGKLMLWGSLKDFWVVRLPNYHELHITKKRSVGEIVIHTGDIPTPEIRSVLSQYLTERADQGERLIDRIIRLCKL